MRYSFIILTLFYLSFLFADDYLENIKETNRLPDADIEYLEFLSQNPLPAKYITKEFLSHYFFVSDSLADKIIYAVKIGKIKNNKYLKSQNIPISLIGNISYFVSFGNNKISQRYYLSTKFDKIPDSYTAKYSFTKGETTLGLTLQKDEDESDFFDYKSMFLLRNTKNYSFILGNYKLNCGLFWSSLTAFKQPYDLDYNCKKILYPNQSTYENFNLFGVAAKVNTKKFSFFPYFSKSKLTASLKDGKISSFDTSGIHTDYKNNVSETIGGLLSKLTLSKINGIIDIHLQNFDKPFYDSNYSKSNIYYNFLLNYKTSNLQINSQNSFTDKKLATVQSIIFGNSKLKNKIAFRYFQDRFPMWHSNPYCQNSKKNNEIGWLYAMVSKPFSHFKMNLFFDLFKQIEPVETFLKKGNKIGVYALYKKHKTTLSLKYEQKKADEIISDSQIVAISNKFAFYIQNKIAKRVFSKTYFAFADKNDENYKSGFLFYQQFQTDIKNLDLIIRFTAVNTKTSIYVYENSIKQVFQTENYNGDDMRFFILGRYRLKKKIGLDLKYRDSFVSSGKRKIYFAIYGEI